MELVSLLEAIRNDYVTQYEAAYEEQSNLAGEVFSEITFQIHGDVYQQLYTVDMVHRMAGSDQAVELAPDPMRRLPWGSHTYRGMVVEVLPSPWGAFAIETIPTYAPDAVFEEWFQKWMNVEGERASDHPVFNDAIHSVSLADGQLHIDLGSANHLAAVELLDMFAEQGVKQIRIVDGRE